MPFIERILTKYQARKVLDTACGTGWHSIALAQRGFFAAGCDVSPAMIQRARKNAADAGVKVDFEIADLSQIARQYENFDALLCLGNSLPHLLNAEVLREALNQMGNVLTGGGIVIFHNLNYDLRIRSKPRFFAAEGSDDRIVWRFADYGTEFITFHTALFEKGASSPANWSVRVHSTLQRPWLSHELAQSLKNAGFRKFEYYGMLDGRPYEQEKSGDLVIVAGR
jgi:SAM-dependent methyltransferase